MAKSAYAAREQLLTDVTACMRAAKQWREQHLKDKWRRAQDIFDCADKAEYTGTTRPNRAHLFVPVVYNQVTELTQEIVDAFDNPRPAVLPKNAKNPRHVLGAKLVSELFKINMEQQDPDSAWFPFCWTSAHNANVRGLAVAMWGWDVAKDRLRFDAPPLEDLFWDPRASLTRAPEWWIHRIFRSPSYVKGRIEDGVWKGRDDSGRVVDFDELKSEATVEPDDARSDTIYREEMDPFSEVTGKEDLLELWYYYDRVDREWYRSLTVKGALTLEDRQVNPDGADYCPAVAGYSLPRAHHFDGESIPDRAADLQLELNKNRNLDIDGRNRELNPKTIVSRRAGMNLEQFNEGSEAVLSNRVGPEAVQEFKYSPTAQAMVPRDAITMRDLHQTTGRTPPTQGKAEGSVRGSQGIGILTQNARAPLTRRIKAMWQTFFYPGFVKAIYLIATKETDEARIMEAAERAGIMRELAALGQSMGLMTVNLQGQIQMNGGPGLADVAIQLLDEQNFYVKPDPDLRMIDPESYERLLMEEAQLVLQGQRVDVLMDILADLSISRGFPEIAMKLRQPVNQAAFPPQMGPGKAAPTSQPAVPGMTRG